MNVLIYVLDALRADHVSCYGYERKTTPNIDAIAADGVVYNRCFSPATWTKPVGASLLTGAYPPVHGMRTREDVFDTDIKRLPELLVASQPTSVGFSTMGNVSTSLGYDRGFDAYHDLYKDPKIIEKRKITDSESEELEHESVETIALPRAEDLSDIIVEWLTNKPDGEFFAFCWSIEPHDPYDPPEPYRGFTNPEYDGPVDGERETLSDVKTDADLNHLKALYDGCIKYNDDEFGRIIDTLEQRGLYNDTLIIVLGDHGDAFNEHGRLTHGHLPYDELAHVPLIIKPPMGHDIEPQVVEEMACLIDVAPTILKAAGVGDFPETVQGRALPPYGPAGSSAPIFSETRSRDIYPAFYSVRTERWKYMKVDEPARDIRTFFDTLRQLYKRGLFGEIIRNPRYYLQRYLHSEKEFLFNKEVDPNEQNNLINGRAERAQEFQMLLENWINEGEQLHDQLSQIKDLNIDRGTSEQLKRLGYID